MWAFELGAGLAELRKRVDVRIGTSGCRCGAHATGPPPNRYCSLGCLYGPVRLILDNLRTTLSNELLPLGAEIWLAFTPAIMWTASALPPTEAESRRL